LSRITLQTDRLILKSLGPDLAEELLEFRKRNEEFFRPWSPAYSDEYLTIEYTIKNSEFIAAETDSKRTIKFVLFKKDEQIRIIGSVSLSNIIMGPFKSCFIGYRIDEQENDKGYATEAITEIIRFGFEELGLHRIEANIIPRNAASVRIAEKTGFTFEGLSKKYLKINGVWEDHLHYVILNDKLE
jgi:[ribosomal protein S5]-alanine N-acetyltransferase